MRRYRRECADIAGHGQLLKKQTKQYRPYPKGTATATEVVTPVHSGHNDSTGYGSGWRDAPPSVVSSVQRRGGIDGGRQAARALYSRRHCSDRVASGHDGSRMHLGSRIFPHFGVIPTLAC